MIVRKLPDLEIKRMREVIANQASTLPQPNEAGLIDIGPKGAIERAANVVDCNGHKVPPGLLEAANGTKEH